MAVIINWFSNCINDLSLKMTQCWVLKNQLMCILLWGKIRFINIPTELLFVSFSFQFKVEMYWNENFISICGSFLFYVYYIGSENELFIDSFVESCVSGSSRVKIFEPFGQGVLNFDVMSFDFSLKPEWKSGVVNTSLSGNIYLLDVVFGESF